ncbi:hypothetical protein E2C01_057459 [Portunus trituberculatus]|uniref:Uncharacterized protein n=1 Tax=Portunus trituberculatus TaxID=210409 RepID=A0A5B7GTJ2_PORTR|nr:hypothetical protein [Portunus trituberculatus]
MLHNLCKDRNIPLPDDDGNHFHHHHQPNGEEGEGEHDVGNVGIVNPARTVTQMRNQFANLHFKDASTPLLGRIDAAITMGGRDSSTSSSSSTTMMDCEFTLMCGVKLESSPKKEESEGKEAPVNSDKPDVVAILSGQVYRTM